MDMPHFDLSSAELIAEDEDTVSFTQPIVYLVERNLWIIDGQN